MIISSLKQQLMYKIYFSLIAILFLSCSTKIRYIGKSLPSTKNIEVFVTEQSIKHPYEYIGQGYIGRFGPHIPDKIQQRAEKLGREKGADAVLITDYYIPNTGGYNALSTYRTDSVARGTITTGNTVVTPSTERGYRILFLKYNK